MEVELEGQQGEVWTKKSRKGVTLMGYFILTGLVVFIILTVLWFILVYNRLAKNRVKVENSWGQVNVQLKMRADLTPNLVETVKGYARHEQETLTKVMETRNKFINAQTPQEAMESSGEMSGMFGRLFALAEQYPELKADGGFVNLQNQLKEIEGKISMYRQFYNDMVMKYNRDIVTFPKNIAASLLGFTNLPYFQVGESERHSVGVKFN